MDFVYELERRREAALAQEKANSVSCTIYFDGAEPRTITFDVADCMTYGDVFDMFVQVGGEALPFNCERVSLYEYNDLEGTASADAES